MCLLKTSEALETSILSQNSLVLSKPRYCKEGTFGRGQIMYNIGVCKIKFGKSYHDTCPLSSNNCLVLMLFNSYLVWTLKVSTVLLN